MPEVVRLQINYKTLEEFGKFQEYGLQELHMQEELQQNFIENNSDSPFYGIYVNQQLIARMSLYLIEARYDSYFSPPQNYYELTKLEVLPEFRNQGFGKALVEFAKSLQLPVKTNARRRSDRFWLNLEFKPVKYHPVRDRTENPYVFLPKGVSLQD